MASPHLAAAAPTGRIGILSLLCRSPDESDRKPSLPNISDSKSKSRQQPFLSGKRSHAAMETPPATTNIQEIRTPSHKESPPSTKKLKSSNFWATVLDDTCPDVECLTTPLHITSAAVAASSSPHGLPYAQQIDRSKQSCAPPGLQHCFENVAESPDFDPAYVLRSLRFTAPKSAPVISSLPPHGASSASAALSVSSPLSSITHCEQADPMPSVKIVSDEASVSNGNQVHFTIKPHPSNSVCGVVPGSLAKAHSCQDCGSAFVNGSQLRLHVGTVHEMKKPYKCDEPSCGALFGHVSSKYRHFRTVHLKRRDFQCMQCGLSFGEKSGLRKHELSVHIGSRPHQCNICGFRFSFRLHLQQHIATVHEKRRPFSCDVCGHTFGQRSSLNRHMRQICKRVDQNQTR